MAPPSVLFLRRPLPSALRRPVAQSLFASTPSVPLRPPLVVPSSPCFSLLVRLPAPVLLLHSLSRRRPARCRNIPISSRVLPYDVRGSGLRADSPSVPSRAVPINLTSKISHSHWLDQSAPPRRREASYFVRRAETSATQNHTTQLPVDSAHHPERTYRDTVPGRHRTSPHRGVARVPNDGESYGTIIRKNRCAVHRLCRPVQRERSIVRWDRCSLALACRSICDGQSLIHAL